ncbi:hypothetical protein RA261_28350, partial [Pseudomonas syringae pv. tagetis]
ALGNPRAKFNWPYVRSHNGPIDLEQELARRNIGKAPGEQTRLMPKKRVTGEGAPKPIDRYDIEREEPPDEIIKYKDENRE